METFNGKLMENCDMIQEAIQFWFNDHDHIRSPFPDYIKPRLKILATERFHKWLAGLNDQAKEEINDEFLCEYFEDILFETAKHLVTTEDEKITIQYPFMPRIQDIIYKNAQNKTEKSTIVSRKIINEGNHKYLVVYLIKENTDEKWETKFELPE